MVAQDGKAAFLTAREAVIATFLKGGVAVCLPDVRGTGETRSGASADWKSSRASLSQSNLMLGQPVLGAQLRDLRTVISQLRTFDAIDAKRIAVWGDSFAQTITIVDALYATDPPANTLLYDETINAQNQPLGTTLSSPAKAVTFLINHLKLRR